MSKAVELIPPRLRAHVLGAGLHAAFALPRPLRRLIAGAPRRIDGQELALDAQLLLKMQALTGSTQLTNGDAAGSRALMAESTAIVDRAPLPGVAVGERTIPTPDGELAARLYRPQSLTEHSPLLVFFHGGGWVIGDLDSHDDLCRYFAKAAGVRVLSVGYRLAPEDPFPAAFDDAMAAFRYAVERAEELGTQPDRIAVGGDSAGGNLAAAVSYHATRAGGPKPAFQLLMYPALDATVRRRSRDLFSSGLLLSDSDITWFLDQYAAPGTDRTDLRLSVLLADDLSGLPPAHVVTAGFDPLRDDGEEYARRLAEAGVPVVARRFEDLIHGFGNVRQAGTRFNEALSEIAGTLRAGLALGGKA
ncbi:MULTISPECIES: alpha/beta hydrolase [unclassified Saccharopolyspora]|uniref:alpha/beta hydrolase n=1 Tax=unclassified Saccharopolyspora TaxID=2646250 RepID=UPI001CD4E8D3|nr:MULTISPECIES: alpha/beta hydrolase [unclassified Saccharopolyspora]MCA1186553.1 alpha/beta hydrolase [Saccharopolyspora sp. 6T]MCA1226178.1 alpha/beta hydrolase [Saccharopolyspora sp. 6M]MCA1281436.1 alpha/beta hydrolase [Saccharopolyspora sp. 7B]